jgi:hypothetical protein
MAARLHLGFAWTTVVEDSIPLCYRFSKWSTSFEAWVNMQRYKCNLEVQSCSDFSK